MRASRIDLVMLIPIVFTKVYLRMKRGLEEMVFDLVLLLRRLRMMPMGLRF